MKYKILVVDDEPDLCEILQFNLEAEGFEVITAHSAEEALPLISSKPHLLLLDVMMDRMSGFDLARLLRSQGNEVPIIFLTALTSEGDELGGFEVGADDFITKPFSFPSVLARIKAVLKRHNAVERDEVLRVGSMSMDQGASKLYVADTEVSLTKKEFLILQLLMQHPGQYFSREAIMAAVWDDDILVGDRSVDVHIARLRRKLGNEGSRIGSRTGFGYYIEP